MGKSSKTIQLEQEIQEINTKITKLNSAKKAVEACKTKVKSTYNNADSDHVDGDKYQTMYTEDQDLIEGFSKSLKSKKDEVKAELDSNLSILSNLLASKKTALAYSVIMYAIKS